MEQVLPSLAFPELAFPELAFLEQGTGCSSARRCW
jgi:hypothetical protein